MKQILRIVALIILTIAIAGAQSDTASAAGQRVVFSSDRSGTTEVYIMDEDGSNTQQVTNLGSSSVLASWIPLSNQILFRSNYDGPDYDLFRINADGTNLQNLTNSAGDESGALASPDGSHIAYLRDDGGGNYGLFVLDLNTLVTTEIVNNFTGFWWLANGQLVTYENQGSGFNLYRINFDGTDKTTLTSDTGNSYFATTSPDGSRIAYFYSDGTSAELRVINVDGSNKTTLTSVSNDPNGATTGLPLWSPDGNQVLFTYQDGSNFPLMSINADGSNLTTVATPSGGGIWGPTGRVWYSQIISGFAELFSAANDGTGAINMTSSGANNSVFISAFAFGPASTQPPTTPPKNPVDITKTKTDTLASSGTTLAAATTISLVILGSITGLSAYRTRYTLR